MNLVRSAYEGTCRAGGCMSTWGSLAQLGWGQWSRGRGRPGVQPGVSFVWRKERCLDIPT